MVGQYVMMDTMLGLYMIAMVEVHHVMWAVVINISAKKTQLDAQSCDFSHHVKENVSLYF
jgi:hypothetical protein